MVRPWSHWTINKCLRAYLEMSDVSSFPTFCLANRAIKFREMNWVKCRDECKEKSSYLFFLRWKIKTELKYFLFNSQNKSGSWGSQTQQHTDGDKIQQTEKAKYFKPVHQSIQTHAASPARVSLLPLTKITINWGVKRGERLVICRSERKRNRMKSMLQYKYAAWNNFKF